MVRTSKFASHLTSIVNQADVVDPRPLEVVDLLDKVDKLLQEKKFEKALELIRRSKSKSSWATNATAVCLLRMGNAKGAIPVLRTIVLVRDVCFQTNTPVVFQANFATALLMIGNYWGCLGVLANINDESNPAVQRLRSAIQRWRDGFTLWQKVCHRWGCQPTSKIELGFPPGDLHPCLQQPDRE
jgi:hypothetical protein